MDVPGFWPQKGTNSGPFILSLAAYSHYGLYSILLRDMKDHKVPKYLQVEACKDGKTEDTHWFLFSSQNPIERGSWAREFLSEPTKQSCSMA